MNNCKPQFWVDGLLRCSRGKHHNHNCHTCDQNTAVLPAPVTYPREYGSLTVKCWQEIGMDRGIKKVRTTC